MNRRTLRMLDVASVLLALSALAIAVLPAGIDDEADAGVPAALATVAHAPPDPRRARLAGVDSTTIGIVSGNAFSSTRRAPTSRFMPPNADAPAPMGLEMSDLASAVDDDAPAAPLSPDSGGDGASGGPDPVPALYGIVGIEGVRHALLTLRRGDPPRLFAVGDRHAGFRISAIDGDRVVLGTARGSRILRLAPPSPRDSSENLP